MSENKDSKTPPTKAKGGENFDDLEDAFFASGDASSFWETAEAEALDDLSEEVAADVDPLNEDSNSILTEQVGVASPHKPDAPAGMAPPEDDPPATPATPEVTEPKIRGTLGFSGGEFYDPSALHPAPDLIADDETEVWSAPVRESELNAPGELFSEMSPDDVQVALSDASASAPTVINEPEDIPSADQKASYVLPGTAEDGWREAATGLERAAKHAAGEEKARLLSESARILLSRVGDWSEAGRRFAAALQAGLRPEDTPKGYADVVASNGDFAELRDLLVARAGSLDGPAAVEALQDAGIVERNHLKDDQAAVVLLERALDIQVDWFTLRLLRELHYRTQSWQSLLGVLDKMATLSTGARAARCRVEEGRIRETECADMEGAAAAYQAALQADPSFLDAFLSAIRVNANNPKPLSDLYKAEAERSEGANAAFWYGRAARAIRSDGDAVDSMVSLYRAAMDASDGISTSIHREAQAAFVAAGRQDEWFDALAAEAKLQKGTARASTLLHLGEVAGSKHAERSIAQLIEAVASDPECTPAADLAVSLLIQAKRPDQALGMLEERSQTAQTEFRMGEISEHCLGDHASAAAHYQQAASLDSSHPFALSSAANALVMAKDWQGAADALMALAGTSDQPDRAARWWQQAAVIQRWQLDDPTAANASNVCAYTASALQPAATDALVEAAARSGNATAHAEALAAASIHLPSQAGRLDSAYRAARIFNDVLQDPAAARTLLHRCVEMDPHCREVVSLLRAVSAQLGEWQAVYDLRRVEASSAAGAGQIWHLIAAANATAQIQGLDAQTVALEILDIDSTHPAALAVLERAALQENDPKRLIGVYRRFRNGTDDPEKRTAVALNLADLAHQVGDRQLTVRSITRVLEASVGPRPYGAMARLAVTIENWGLAEAALHADGDQVGFAQLLESTSDDHKRVASTWRSITKASPDCPEAFGGLERALTRMASRDGLAETHGALAKLEDNASIANMHALLAGHLFENEENVTKALAQYQSAFANQTYRGKAFEALVRLQCNTGNASAVRQLFEDTNCKDCIALADAMLDAGQCDEAAKIYKKALSQFGEKDDSSIVLPLVLRLEQSLIADQDWPAVFELLDKRLNLSESPLEVTLIEAKRRWVLSERMVDSEEAWEFYRKLHEDQPEDPEVLENLARIAGARGESSLAIQFLDGLSNIAATTEDAARYQRRVAEVHKANGDKDKARSAFLRALDHEPQDLGALSGLKSIAEETQDWQGLAGILTREIQIQTGEDKVNTARAIAELWETKLEDSAVAIEAWRRVLELVPGDQVALQHLVDQAEGLEDWPSFVQDGQALVHYLEEGQRCDLLGRMGRAALHKLQREDDAVRFLEEATTGNQPSAQASDDLERIYAGRGAWDQVVECLTRRAQTFEGVEAVALLLRAAHTRKNQIRDRRGAADLYEKVLAIDPQDPIALQFVGEFLFENDDLTRAVGIFERIDALDIERDMDDFDVQMDFAQYCFHFGEALRRLNRNGDAIKRYEQALNLNGNHLPTLEAVGPLYVTEARWNDANKVFRQVLQLTGGQGDAKRLARVYACLGVVEHAQGQVDKAVRRFDKALQLQPNDIEALQGYAAVLFVKQDWNNLLITCNNIIHHASERQAFIDAYLMKGFVLDTHMSLADKAAQHYEKGLSFDASHPNSLMRIAELALRKEDWDRALSYAGRALAVGGDADATTTAYLQLISAIGYSRVGKPDEQQVAFEAAEMHPELKIALKDAANDPTKLHEVLRQRLQSAP
jgi:tetratricopeptide (TPR) repeat protein